MPKTTNRTAATDQWLDWLSEAERWSERTITDGEEIDRLYEFYLDGETPLYAMMARPVEGLRPVAIPVGKALRQVEEAYLARPSLQIGWAWIWWGAACWAAIVACWFIFWRGNS